MPRLAILDLDGTLVDSLDDLAASVNHALATVGLPPRTTDEIRGFVGEGARVLLERALGPHAERLEPALAAWRAHYEVHCLDATRTYPGLAAALAGAGRTLAVHTNKPGAMARRILDGLGLLGRFAVVVGGDEAPRKPDPEGVRIIQSRVGATDAETVFVGDSPVDVATARAAGVQMVAVGWGLRSRAALLDAGATVLVESAAELVPWLA
ncbi:phosphoglycolate phosphatase [Anaeromyxobacter dehalogenans 2CP-1]|uniref:phosphoglycolate phosphatase n=1 Tax=Anaeromyxobacter dehalogenans (strain ATCC BAA-258 / DSM 21875 / 2CP-1) TaxID=455488 RepID=B8JG01_ANAD2|nr:HAD-IA family hydrolase [Anaeromyxobacter dehalogenans]ACL64589.1 phosphoglycolate phosphatase [Anaeromyxobacter dehalogenans 2CP-1]